MKEKKGFIWTEVILGLLVVLLALCMFLGKNGKSQYKISVILQDADDSKWAAVKYGLRTAGEDCGAEISVVNMESGSSAKRQKQLINAEIKNGADGLIVQPAGGAGAEAALKKIKKRVPVMLLEPVESEESKKEERPVTSPDNYEMGKTLACELLADYNGNLKGKQIGFLSETMDMDAVRQRDLGFREGIKGQGAEIVWSVGGSFTEASGALTSWPKVDIVVALDDRSVRTAGAYASDEELWGAVVYGIGHSTEAVYYLDKREVECLIVPDEFDVGYKSLKEVVKALEQSGAQMEGSEAAFTVLRRDVLFTKENQKILFTMSQ